MGRHPGCNLGLPELLLLQIPPVSSLATTIVATLDCPVCPPDVCSGPPPHSAKDREKIHNSEKLQGTGNQAVMKNISFILDGYQGIYNQRYIFVVVLSLLYPVMIISNSVLIYIICIERGLHKPMYIFICNLLACSDTLSNSIYGVVMMCLTILLVVTIFYTYVRIIFICLKLSKTGRVKFSTCVPHLIALLNFVIGSCFELFQSRFNMRHVPYSVRVVLSLYVLILSPIINPIMYGVKTQKIKEAIIKRNTLKVTGFCGTGSVHSEQI
ncbi:uncharacterized protein [Garra rufa]|uniref:uncharacterized protein n=1 Tax=Garra rufa TaxID=137080 RepID=UPI003CCEDFB6